MRNYRKNEHGRTHHKKMEDLLIIHTCPDCEGARLRCESRQVTVAGETIVALSRMSLTDVDGWLADLSTALSPEEWSIAEPVVADLHERVRRLVDVGVGYLSLERPAPTLSVGEAQRLRLASLLGSGLTRVLYVLDEPTIGLHPRDTARLVEALLKLRDLGNTVLVIEHDLDVIRAADHVIDMGPGAGEQGGHVVAAASPKEIVACSDSITADYLAGRASVPLPERRRSRDGQSLVIKGAREHNLRNVTLEIPLGLFVAVTGVSGSGKSSLMLDTLDRAARRRFYDAADAPGEHEAIEGWEHLDKVITIDQSPIGRTPRSNAATYSDAFTAMRKVFADTPDAHRCGLEARHFSFNVPDGRCVRCQGAGVLTVNMHFMPDVLIRCPACHGRRFKHEVLQVTYRGHTIADVLDLEIDEASGLFEDVPAVSARLFVMVDVGLGYLKLGQPATTLSGGEAQRIKLAKELGRRGTGRTLYLLDEPTTGLHAADVARLVDVLQRLVDAGNTVVVIEHNQDVVKTADWVIDLGPEGGDAGGTIVAQGTPEQIARTEGSLTGTFLRPLLNGSTGQVGLASSCQSREGRGMNLSQEGE